MKRTSLLFAGLLTACAAKPFPNKPPMWVDTDDFRTFSPPPEDFVPATIFDGVDESILRPLPRLFALDAPGRSVNVNAVDEVPDSSWFTNRIGKGGYSTEATGTGACDSTPLDGNGPYEIIAGKPDGFNPGFLVKAPNGLKYFFKFDQHELQPERMSMAETVGSLIYHAVGFTTPCYQVLYFDRKALTISKTATVKNKKGEKIPITDEFVNQAFKDVRLRPDGKVRAVSSRFLDGKVLGPWRYWGRTSDDPNDVIDHQDRREVRAGYVLASWISHFDTRDQNTLRTFITEKGKSEGYVRHNILDFGDSLGNLTDLDVMSRRLGYAYYADFAYLAEDFLTLGTIERPWDKVKYGPGGPVLGYFDVDNFDPEKWSPGYPNPAFKFMKEADAAWMARLIAEFRDEHIDAMIAKGRLEDKTVEKQLRQTLIGRRDKLLARWFRKISPLTQPEVKTGGTSLCLRDLAIYAGIYGPLQRKYSAWTLGQKDSLTSAKIAARATKATKAPGRKIAEEEPTERVCVTIPAPAAHSRDTLAVRVHATSTVNPEEKAMQVHLYKEGGSWKIAGLERFE